MTARPPLSNPKVSPKASLAASPRTASATATRREISVWSAGRPPRCPSALDALERATAPKIGPFFAPTVVHSPTLDVANAAIDECFA
jgi:hypothetical protein